MPFRRRSLLTLPATSLLPAAERLALAAGLAALPAAAARAQSPSRKDSLVLGVTLEPPGLDPTAGAASSIGEVTLYNVYETLTKVRSDGTVAPLLAESWTVTPDNKTWAFRIRPNVAFHNGEKCDAATVKWAFERAATAESVNKDKAVFTNIVNMRVTDPQSIVITLKSVNPDFLFQVGQATAVIVEPKSAPTNAAAPIGTGPYRLESWTKGASLVLSRWDGHRDARSVPLKRVTVRFISDASAQVAAMLAGDVDVFPRISAAKALKQFQGNAKKYQVLVGGSRAKTILAINNRRKPLDDVRVRRAITMAIDRKALIDGAVDGFGVPIGSYYVPGAPGYVDLTSVHAYNPERARALLKEAGVTSPLELTIKLPPPPYARQSGEIVAAMLGKVGIQAKLENVEWPQWLSGVFKDKAYDLTIISHVEPLDFNNFAKPDYYWNYANPKFNALWERIQSTADAGQRNALMGEAQRLVADDAVAAYLFQPTWITVAKAGLHGLWKDMPLFANDLASMHW